MEDLRENYKRAAYADYESKGKIEIKNNLSTTCRLFTAIYRN